MILKFNQNARTAEEIALVMVATGVVSVVIKLMEMMYLWRNG